MNVQTRELTYKKHAVDANQNYKIYPVKCFNNIFNLMERITKVIQCNTNQGPLTRFLNRFPLISGSQLKLAVSVSFMITTRRVHCPTLHNLCQVLQSCKRRVAYRASSVRVRSTTLPSITSCVDLLTLQFNDVLLLVFLTEKILWFSN